MSTEIKINYVNKSMNDDLPKVFLFLKNEIPTFDSLKEGVAWKVIEDVGRGSSCGFTFPVETAVSASWNSGSCLTSKIISQIGSRYVVDKNNTGIVIEQNGNAGDSKSIDVSNKINVKNGISVNLYKDDKIIVTKKIVAFDQKATFVVHPKLYWGLASEIQEGMELSSAVLNSNNFFEQDLTGATEVTVGLYGNAKEGYQFKIIEQS